MVKKSTRKSGSKSNDCNHNGNHGKKMPMKGKMPMKPMKDMR